MTLRRICGVIWSSYGGLREVRSAKGGLEGVKLKWAKRMLELTNVEVSVIGQPLQHGPVVLIGNHLSYLDIPLLLRFAPAVNFVAKEELRGWPIFGAGMTHTGTIFVQRDSADSRGSAMKALHQSLEETPKPVAIFPSGTTSLSESTPWKNGAFRLAMEAGIPIQAFRIRYFPLRRAAFIGEDSFLLHLWRLCRGGPVRAIIEFAEPELVLDIQASKKKWNDWCRNPQALGLEQLNLQAAV